MVLLVAVYVFLGCFLEAIGMVLVTVPVFLPLVIANGWDPIWFGVLPFLAAPFLLIALLILHPGIALALARVC